MDTMNVSKGPVYRLSREQGHNGLDIGTTAQLLRRYAFVERALLRMLAGWFLAAPAYEDKYALAYHLLDHADHVGWIRARLLEMRGGQIDASVETALVDAAEQAVDAGDIESFLGAAYGELERALLDGYRDHLAAADPCANAAEVRMLQRMIPAVERHLTWADERLSRAAGARKDDHRARIAERIVRAGGVSGLAARPVPLVENAPASPDRFERPKTIIFDDRIRRGELTRYEARQSADDAAVEDFKVFFNELYAAALLASILYDAAPVEAPWEFLHDVARHFWDEVRHSQFGEMRLKELGTAPETCNPVLFERSQGLPILHRFCYLTFGLETHFMPRKRPRVSKYARLGDTRSQLFADQDWSDETLHIRFGKRWINHFLENDFRSADDILDEVRVHLEAVSGEKQERISAPF